MIKVACVRTGTKYPVEYVYRLRSMIKKYLPVEHIFFCLTDRPQDLEGVNTVVVSDSRLTGWWGKMALFDFAAKSIFPVIYFDLDTVICGSLIPLAEVEVEFAICANFTRAAGYKEWPCNYGSCVMTFAPYFGLDIYHQYMKDAEKWIIKAGGLGDQWVIEKLYPFATLLQDILPIGFFLGYRQLDEKKPEWCSVVVFAGSQKPHNCEKEWIKQAWAA